MGVVISILYREWNHCSAYPNVTSNAGFHNNSMNKRYYLFFSQMGKQSFKVTFLKSLALEAQVRGPHLRALPQPLSAILEEAVEDAAIGSLCQNQEGGCCESHSRGRKGKKPYKPGRHERDNEKETGRWG